MLVTLLLLAAADTTYKLGGPRQVVATVATADGDHVVRVRMLAVAAFDAATNDAVSRQLAEGYAHQALARHLAREKGAQLELVGGRVASAGRDDKQYAMTYRVAEKGATVVAAGSAARLGRKQFAFDTPFFTRKRDLMELGRLVGESLAADLAAAEKAVKPDDADAVKVLLVRIAELEERGEKHFKKLADEIAGDKLLLTDERDEAKAAVEKHREGWDRRLKEAARKYVREEGA